MRQIPAGWRQLFLLSADYGILPGRGGWLEEIFSAGAGVFSPARPPKKIVVRNDVMGESHAEVYWESTCRDVWKLVCESGMMVGSCQFMSLWRWVRFLPLELIYHPCISRMGPGT